MMAMIVMELDPSGLYRKYCLTQFGRQFTRTQEFRSKDKSATETLLLDIILSARDWRDYLILQDRGWFA
jgi:hypothetical protein